MKPDRLGNKQLELLRGMCAHLAVIVPDKMTRRLCARGLMQEAKPGAFDHIAWADRFIADLPFLTLEQLDALEANKLELARFAQLQAIAVDKAREFEEALKAARAAFQ